MAYVTPRTWVAGDVLTAAQLNQDIRDNVGFLGNPPRAQARRTSVQSIPNAAWTLVTFTVEDVDTNTMFAVGTGDRFTCQTAGRYLICFSAEFATNGTGTRMFGIATGTTPGSGFIAKTTQPATTVGTGASLAMETVLTVGINVSFHVYQNSTAALNLQADSATEPCRVTMRWVGLT